VHALLEVGAEIKCVDPHMPPETAALHDASVLLIRKPYCPEHLEGATLVFACTDDRVLNAQIARDAQWVGALVNVADQPEDCDFTMPAVARDGDVVVAVGTGGSSPALAGRLRNHLAAALPPRTGEFAAALARLREEHQRDPDTTRRSDRMRRLASHEAYEAFLHGGNDALRKLLTR